MLPEGMDVSRHLTRVGGHQLAAVCTSTGSCFSALSEPFAHAAVETFRKKSENFLACYRYRIGTIIVRHRRTEIFDAYFHSCEAND